MWAKKSDGTTEGKGSTESDGIAVFENIDGTFSKYEPKKIEETVKLTNTITMFVENPLYPETTIYEGRQIHLGSYYRDLAIKVIPRSEKSEKEARLLLSVEHPNIVRVIETGRCPGTTPQIFIAMELCSKNLQQYVNENKQETFNFNKSLSFSKQLVAAVAFMHKKQIVHRDLKPANILISMCGNQIKVADLGLSRNVSAGQSAAYVTSATAGTEGFKAPETFHHSSTYAYSADIFPLGINVYFIFTNGEHPFGSNPFKWAVNIMEDTNHDLSRIPEFGAKISEKRSQLISSLERMLDHDPEKRPTADQILDEEFFNECLHTSVTKQVGAMEISDQKPESLQTSVARQVGAVEIFDQKPEKEDLQNILQVAERRLDQGDGDSAIQRVEEFVFNESRSAMDMKNMGDDLKEKGRYVRAMIFYKISHDLHKRDDRLSSDTELQWINDRIWDICAIIELLAEDSGISQKMAINHGMKFAEKMLEELREVENARPSWKARVEADCLGALAQAHLNADELEEGVRFGEDGLNIMKQQFGENASIYKLYGDLLHMLGVAYHRCGRYSDIECCYVTAIEAYKKALDYENEEERQGDIVLTKRNLAETRRMLLKRK